MEVKQLQVTKVTVAGRISLGDAMPAMGLKEGDVVQIVQEGENFLIARVDPVTKKAISDCAVSV
jgi:hypothetical protein